MKCAENKLKSVGCCMNSVLSSGTSVAEALFSYNASRYTVFPGFCDVHVHFREPGFSYK